MNAFCRFFCLGLLPLLASCGHIDTKTAEHVDLSHYQHVFVERLLTDGHGVADLIARELRQRGWPTPKSSSPMSTIGTSISPTT